MFENPAAFSSMVERIGIPAAFGFLMVLVVVYFANQHRAERREWREAMEGQVNMWRKMMEEESRLNRAAIGELRNGLGELSESFAFLDGKLTGKKRVRKK